MEKISEFLHYNHRTGVIVWIKGRRAGKRAGTPRKDGRRQINFQGKKLLEHRVIFYWMTGRWPADELDHKNRNFVDHRWDNLREATKSQNQSNRKRSTANTVGLKGVWFSKKHQKFESSVADNGKRKWLGYFNTPEEAHAAYVATLRAIKGEFARAA